MKSGLRRLDNLQNLSTQFLFHWLAWVASPAHPGRPDYFAGIFDALQKLAAFFQAIHEWQEGTHYFSAGHKVVVEHAGFVKRNRLLRKEIGDH